MKRVPVVSSHIASVGYEEGILEVEFKNGTVGQYLGVPQWTYDSLMADESKGSFLHKFVRNTHPYVQISPPRPK